VVDCRKKLVLKLETHLLYPVRAVKQRHKLKKPSDLFQILLPLITGRMRLIMVLYEIGRLCELHIILTDNRFIPSQLRCNDKFFDFLSKPFYIGIRLQFHALELFNYVQDLTLNIQNAFLRFIDF